MMEPSSSDSERDSLLAESKKDVSQISSNGQTRITILCILFTELCERLTYYSIIGNLVLFFTNQLNFTSGDAVVLSLVFTGSAYFFPIVGGYLADAVCGFFNTIYGAGLIYIIGTTLLPIVAMDYTQWGLVMPLASKRGFFLTGMVLICIGTGGIKANVSPFGAHQLEHDGERAVQTFFNWFYWFINFGSVIAYSGVSYVQQEISFSIGYLIPAISMVISVAIFVIGKKYYIQKPAQGSLLVLAIKVIIEGVKNKSSTGRLYRLRSFLDYAKISNGGTHLDSLVDDVKMFCQVIPVFMSLVLYWTLYFQMQGSYLLQAERMDLNVGAFNIPAASLSLFNSIIILILIPLMDRVVYPLMERFWKRPSPLSRIGVGMVLASMSLFVAGVIEIYRKDEIMRFGTFPQDVGGHVFPAARISVFLQVPQFVLIGASEVFASITGLEFAFSESPSSTKGLVMGINMITTGLGSFLASLLIPLVNACTPGREWYPNEINDGYMENFFFLLGVLMFVNFLLYIIIAKRYVYAKDRELIVDDSFVKYGSNSVVYTPISETSNEIIIK